jgi:hypothetical protein
MPADAWAGGAVSEAERSRIQDLSTGGLSCYQWLTLRTHYDLGVGTFGAPSGIGLRQSGRMRISARTFDRLSPPLSEQVEPDLFSGTTSGV